MSMLPRQAFWFLRHGETDWNKNNLTQGTTNVPLNDAGLKQAHDAADLLVGRGITDIACSPLDRAHHTARVVADRLGIPLTVHADLREANFGVHEGEPMGAWFAAWTESRATPDGGERFEDVSARVLGTLATLLVPGRMLLVVAHGGVFRTVRAAMGFTPTVRTANGVPLLCRPEPDEAWSLTDTTGATVRTTA